MEHSYKAIRMKLLLIHNGLWKVVETATQARRTRKRPQGTGADWPQREGPSFDDDFRFEDIKGGMGRFLDGVQGERECSSVAATAGVERAQEGGDRTGDEVCGACKGD
jgi:hypothetical protein